MSKEMTRAFQHLRLTEVICLGLREAIRPFTDSAYLPHGAVVEFCKRLYLAYYSLEADPDLETVDFPADEETILVINNLVSVEDGDWAKDILHQTRQVLYELTTGHEAVRLAAAEDTENLLNAVTLGPVDGSVLTVPKEVDASEKDEGK